MGDARDVATLEGLLGHDFADSGLLLQALTHRSYANENRELVRGDNEKLEFLGDAVLDLAIGHLLMRSAPELGEGELSVARARVVSEDGLSRVARDLNLGDWLYLGRGEERSGGRDKASLLADAFEAVCAAIYLDGGFEPARAFVERVLASSVDEALQAGGGDSKTRLQERVQARGGGAPTYRVVDERGPDHDKTFEVAVLIDSEELARAEGKSKKAAEQGAAEAALSRLKAGD